VSHLALRWQCFVALALAAPAATLGQSAATSPLQGADLLAALRALLSTPVATGANTVVVGHAYPYYTLVGGQYLSEGEADVLRPRGADFEVVARVSLAQWRSSF
jgi:hypothetical protein